MAPETARPGEGAAPPPATLVLLGTAGGPTPKRRRAAPAQALCVGDSITMIDCGNGAARQMALARLPFRSLRHVFVTHHHSDHVADLVTLPLLAWAADLDRPITLHGPPPLRGSVRAGLRAARFDIELRSRDEGRPPLDALVHVREIRPGPVPRVVHRDERMTVRAVRVEHPPIEHALAYRFDTAAGSVVISGDTAPCESLVELARGADVLVHEVLLLEPHEVSAWLGTPEGHPLARHVVASHTGFRSLGAIARASGVGTLVLSHFVPGDALVDEERILAAIRADFSGEVVFGEDLLEIDVRAAGCRRVRRAASGPGPGA